MPSPWWGLLLIPLAAFAWRRPRYLAVCFFGAGISWAILQGSLILSKTLPAELEGEDIWAEGFVASIPERAGPSLKFDFDITGMSHGGDAVSGPERARLRLYHSQLRPGIGEKWRLHVRLKRPHGFQNPGGFDYEGWLFRNRIHATGYVRRDPENRRLASHWTSYPLGRVRAHLARRIRSALPDQPLAGVIMALATGSRSGITDGQWQVLRRTGTNHLVAISGLHIGLVAGLVFFLARWLWALPGTTVLRWPAPKVAAIAAILAAFVYAALAGFAIPTQRALIMLTVGMGGLLLGRSVPPTHLLATALFFVLLADPFSVMSAGFWLSFAAVGVIITAMSGWRARKTWWVKWGYIQWVIAIGLLPLLLALFQQASVSAPLVNIIAVPVVGLMVVPVTLLGVAASALLPEMVAGLLFQLAAWLLHWLWLFMEGVSNLKHSVWAQHAPVPWSLACAGIGTLWLLAPRGMPARWLGVVWLLPMFLVRPAGPAAGELWFTLLDVGQGTAAVARTRKHTLVYDTGPRFSARFDTGRAVVTPFLRNQGVDIIDLLVVSHGDNDHIGGARSVLEGMPVKQLLSSVPDRLPGARPCHAGQSWRWDGVVFKTLHPIKGRHSSENNASCVVMIESPYGNILLTGDIEAAAERSLTVGYGDALAADILVVPHHGSKTSSTAAFIAAVDPELALFPTGYRNRYRHPHPKVVTRYVDRGIALYDSASHGAIQIRLGQDGAQIDAFRQTRRRYWFAD